MQHTITAYKTTLSSAQVQQLIDDVRSKKELAFFSKETITEYAQKFLLQNKKLREEFEADNLRKEYKQLIKNIREKARRIYGSYITKKYGTRDKLLAEKDFEGMLNIHLSTKERKSAYEEIFTTLIDKTCTPTSILDIGCGFNPFAAEILFSITKKKITYHATDISKDDTDFLQKYLNISSAMTAKSEAFPCDASKETEHVKLTAPTDWCLLLKALDPIEESNENISYKLIPMIQSKWIIASFPTITISQKPMRNKRRSWFEKVLNRQELEFETVEIANELFYIIKNHET
jgi:16S rRNA (guanine(1405)-N(7))-methyltransferase